MLLGPIIQYVVKRFIAVVVVLMVELRLLGLHLSLIGGCVQVAIVHP